MVTQMRRNNTEVLIRKTHYVCKNSSTHYAEVDITFQFFEVNQKV